jgi:large subunit ribosomal protein L29
MKKVGNVIKDLSTKEIHEKIVEEKEILQKMKINHVVSPLDNPMKLKYSRRQIAKLKTELNKRKIEGK